MDFLLCNLSIVDFCLKLEFKKVFSTTLIIRVTVLRYISPRS